MGDYWGRRRGEREGQGLTGIIRFLAFGHGVGLSALGIEHLRSVGETWTGNRETESLRFIPIFRKGTCLARETNVTFLLFRGAAGHVLVPFEHCSASWSVSVWPFVI